MTGAVNAVRRDDDGRLQGDNTDGLAFVTALRAKRVVLTDSVAISTGNGTEGASGTAPGGLWQVPGMAAEPVAKRCQCPARADAAPPRLLTRVQAA